jgi:hypothetical protein
VTDDLLRLFARRAELLRELANLEDAVGGALAEAMRPEPASDDALSLVDAAGFLGEPVETFRRRLDYRKALLRRPGERRLRYSRAVLERIRQDRLAANGAP